MASYHPGGMESSEAVAAGRTCPSCSAPLAVDPRYVTWCPQCDWNVEPSGAATVAEKPRERRRRERAVRRAERLHEELRRGGVDDRGIDAGRILTYALALLVLLIPVAMLTGALLLLLGTGFSVPGIVLAAVIAAAALLARPRLGHREKRLPVLTRAQAPVLYALLDRVAGAMGARAPAWVVVEPAFNAGTRFVGLRRRVELRIGMPLWSLLDDPQRIAVLGHETAHQTNGDTAHSLVVGGAMDTLIELQLLFMPSRVLHSRSIGGALSELVRAGLAAMFAAARRGMELLLARSHQRAEYRADTTAARVAGADATASTLHNLLLSDSCRFAVQRARSRGSDEDALSIVRAHVATVPDLEKERLRRVATRRGSRVDDSHPPTPLRSAWVQALPRAAPQVSVDAAESAAVDAELRGAWARVH